MKRVWVALGLAMGLWALTGSSAQAHALLLRSNPEANAVLDTAPRFVELVFSEALEPSFSSASVLDADGLRVDNQDSNIDPADPARMTLTLRPFSDGVYTVIWNALSSVDGHATTGAFSFAVGAGVAAPASSGPSLVETSVPASEVLARWWMYLGTAILAGGSLFLLAVWRPAVREWGQGGETIPPPAPPWITLGRVGVVVFLSANLLGLWAQGNQAAGGRLISPLDPALATVLFTTRFGALWSARLLLALGLAAVLPRSRSAGAQAAALGLAAGLLLAISLGSHAATEPKPALPLLGDWLHLLAASVWVGGLIHLVTGLLLVRGLPDRPRTRLVAGLIPRFSRLALPTVGFLVGSGIYAGVLRVGSWPGLFGTAYGKTLLAKIVIALAMIGFGAVNLLLVTPRMRRGAARSEGAPGLVGVFRRLVTTESILGCAALLAAGLLTSQAPARSPAAAGFLAARGSSGDLRATLEISPGRVGANAFGLMLTSGGQPLVGAREVKLRFTPGSTDVPPVEAVLTELGQGRYSTQGTYLSLPDRWQVQVAVRREGAFDAFVDLTVDLRPADISLRLPWSRVIGALLTVCGPLGWAAIRRRRVGLPSQILRTLPVALSLAGVAVFARPTPAGNLINPVPPSQASIAAGQALYQEDCAVCHGLEGKGDGPLGLTLNPRPADLTLHTIPGVHSDGQLFDWITNGYRGSVMPAWRDRLSDTLRWDIVNYLRTLAPGANP
jgi:copper transport protein